MPFASLYIDLMDMNMNTTKKIALVILLAAIPVFASAQKLSKIPQRNEIVLIESGEDSDAEALEVFDSPVDGVSHYYLSVGHLGFGDEVIQVLFDPIFELFIPLGNNLGDALETLKKLQALYKSEPGTSMEIEGCLAFGFPKDEKLETVTVTYRKVLLSRMLEFSVQREGYIRSAHVQKSDFGSLVSSVKLHHKMFPKK